MFLITRPPPLDRCEGESGVAGEGKVVVVPKFHSWGKCLNEYQLRLDVQHFP